jgi:hypothetical protein
MRSKPLVVVMVLSMASVGATAGSGHGLMVDIDQVAWPQWRARLQLTTEPLVPATALTLDSAAAQPRSAALFGDYYVARPYFGVAGGVRLTSGIVFGPRGAVMSATHATPPNELFFSALARPTAAAALTDTPSEQTQAWPYLGVGYSDGSEGGGWGFSADLGVAAQGLGWARSRRASVSPSLEDSVRELRLTPVLQLGVSYRF